MRLRPLHDWVLIKRSDPEGQTRGGIIIPESARDKPAEGTIIALGPGEYKKERGKRERFIPTSLTPGQRVIFTDYMARDVELDGEKITLIREGDILGTFERPLAGKPSYQLDIKTEKPPLVQRRLSPGRKETPVQKTAQKAGAPTAGKERKTESRGKATKMTALPRKKKTDPKKSSVTKAGRKPSRKSVVARTTATRKQVQKKAEAAKKQKKAAVKKVVAKKKAVKKRLVKKPTVRKPVAKKPAQKKVISRKTVRKRSAASEKTAPKKISKGKRKGRK